MTGFDIDSGNQAVRHDAWNADARERGEARPILLGAHAGEHAGGRRAPINLRHRVRISSECQTISVSGCNGSQPFSATTTIDGYTMEEVSQALVYSHTR